MDHLPFSSSSRPSISSLSIPGKQPKSSTDLPQELKAEPSFHVVQVPTAIASSSSKTRAPRSQKEHDSKGKKKEVKEILYDGPLAHTEFERLRHENDLLRRQIHDQKKLVKKQKKMVEELKADLVKKADCETELQALKASSRINEELVGAVESSILCQICMDLLLKPYVLSPCGHCYCVDCLSSWFRQAPVPDIDLNDTEMTPEQLQEDPSYIMHRQKTCPTCRAIVSRRPEPVFVVKSIAAAIAKARAQKQLSSTLPLSDEPSTDDPWKDLFPPTDSEGSESSEGGDSDLEAYVYGLVASDSEDGDDEIASVFYDLPSIEPPIPFLHDSESDNDSHTSSGSHDRVRADDFLDTISSPIIHHRRGNSFPEFLASEDEHDIYRNRTHSHHRPSSPSDAEDFPHVNPRWEPPRHFVPRHIARNLEVHELDLCRRGCTLAMIHMFWMTYTHDEGIVAHVSSLHEDNFLPRSRVPLQRCARVFLGWNIDLDDNDDDGTVYMHDALRDLALWPEGWRVSVRQHSGGAEDARRLAPYNVHAGYSTTDSEHYLPEEDEDDDDDTEW
ncbi:hypothetical protein DL96DRAFT_1704894 [Flagelloscypha sp. PMI_526]|nr:hypothetical protein DL96DRAFT_1704894 [Flagelloscypha sp. PMI_526]